MFCSKCGTNNPEGANHCISCGAQLVSPDGQAVANDATQVAPQQPVQPQVTPVAPQQPVQPQVTPVVPQQVPPMQPQMAPPVQPQQMAYAEPEKKSKKGLVIGLIIGAIVLIGAIVAVLFLFVFKKGGSSSDPKGVVEKFVDALEDGDSEKLMECVPPFMTEGVSDSDMQSLSTALSTIKMIEAMGRKLSFDIGESKTMSDDEYNRVADEVESMYPDYTVQDAATVKFGMSVSGSMYGQTYDESQETDLIVIKIDGKWYIYNSSNGLF